MQNTTNVSSPKRKKIQIQSETNQIKPTKSSIITQWKKERNNQGTSAVRKICFAYPNLTRTKKQSVMSSVRNESPLATIKIKKNWERKVGEGAKVSICMD